MAEGQNEFVGNLRAIAGDMVGWLLINIGMAVWDPSKLPKGDALNPFREAKPESEAMKSHKASWERRKWQVLTGG